MYAFSHKRRTMAAPAPRDVPFEDLVDANARAQLNQPGSRALGLMNDVIYQARLTAAITNPGAYQRLKLSAMAGLSTLANREYAAALEIARNEGNSEVAAKLIAEDRAKRYYNLVLLPDHERQWPSDPTTLAQTISLRAATSDQARIGPKSVKTPGAAKGGKSRRRKGRDD